MKRILLAIDGSDHSKRAAQVAGELSASLDVPVDVVNVVSNTRSVTTGPIDEYARIEKIAISHRELLQSLGADLVVDAASTVKESGGRVDTTEVLIGSPAHEIVHYAENQDADCIVMGRRGLGEVSGLFLGSVSHKVGHLTERTLVTTEQQHRGNALLEVGRSRWDLRPYRGATVVGRIQGEEPVRRIGSWIQSG